jgi:hypothetical protein
MSTVAENIEMPAPFVFTSAAKKVADLIAAEEGNLI